MNSDMQRRAIAAREAHIALLDLKKMVEGVAKATHATELEAVRIAITSKNAEEVTDRMRAVLERLGSSDFEDSLSKARQAHESLSLNNRLANQCSRQLRLLLKSAYP